uniref:hypothetical protein n=1 Tax=Microbacterium sp. SORGH_AS_1204 TaxID=3041785 RepID=UPI0027D88094|nr:hypothetical protein [Microbacterium sp. SORGH_AS_1204]
MSPSDVPAVAIDPVALSSVAASLHRYADSVSDSSERLTTRWSTLHLHYQAPEVGELLSRMSVVPRAVDDFAATMKRVATIMAQLADHLALAREQEKSLRDEIDTFRDAVRRFRASSDVPEWGNTGDTWGPGQFIRNQTLLSECLAVRTLRDTAIEEARGDLASIGRPDLLLPPTESVDTPTPSISAWAAEYDAVADDVGFAILEKLSAGTADDARALLALHDDWRRLFLENAPDAAAVSTWWTQRLTTNPRALDALVFGASLVIGSLGGVPPASRVAANAVNAKMRLPVIDAEIRRLDEAGRGGEMAAAAAERKATLERLRKQRDYLQRAADGDVQLYLYEPDSHSIIEMIGTLDDTTTDVITYVPGTFTSVHSFYGDEVQQVGRWLQTNDSRVTTFVWKEGPFPGEDADGGQANLGRILEANDEPAARASGRLIADFQRELLCASPQAASAQQDAMGHSWGLAAVTSSEVAGARYSQVHSLAGAGMPSGWTPNADTRYFHWGYTDALSIAQGTGVVWDGHIPTRDSSFSSHLYSREGDFPLYLPSGIGSDATVFSAQPPPSIPLTTRPLENHNLIASQDAENQSALEDIYREVRK